MPWAGCRQAPCPPHGHLPGGTSSPLPGFLKKKRIRKREKKGKRNGWG